MKLNLLRMIIAIIGFIISGILATHVYQTDVKILREHIPTDGSDGVDLSSDHGQAIKIEYINRAVLSIVMTFAAIAIFMIALVWVDVRPVDSFSEYALPARIILIIGNIVSGFNLGCGICLLLTQTPDNAPINTYVDMSKVKYPIRVNLLGTLLSIGLSAAFIYTIMYYHSM